MGASAQTRVVVIEDHPAVRAGTCALIDSEPGLRAVGSAGDAHDGGSRVLDLTPDVVVLDHQLPDGDGLSLCRTLRRRPDPPAVVLYSAFANDAMTVPAHLAGAAAVVDKTRTPRELCLAIRRAAAGDVLLPAPPPELLQAARWRIRRDDFPLLGMLVAGATVAEVASALQLPVANIEERIDMLLSALIPRPRRTT